MSTESELLLSIIVDLRGILGTPETASVVQHARNVVAEAQRAREDLAQAIAALSVTTDSLEQVREDYDTTFELLQAAQVDARRWRALMQPGTEAATDIIAAAEKWRAVPWDVVGSIIFDWELTNDIDDAMHDLRTWYDRNKPEEVTA
jgi:hypothetical protein